jgi:nicotinamidase-related amidase
MNCGRRAMRDPALIVIDMLNDFLARWKAAPKQRLIVSTNSLIDLLRHRDGSKHH